MRARDALAAPCGPRGSAHRAPPIAAPRFWWAVLVAVSVANLSAGEPSADATPAPAAVAQRFAQEGCRVALQGLLAGDSEILRGADPATLAVLDACSELLGAGLVEEDVDLPEDTRRLATPDWWKNKETGYASVMVLAAGIIFVCLFLLEAVCLRSTLLGSSLSSRLSRVEVKMRKSVRNAMQSMDSERSVMPTNLVTKPSGDVGPAFIDWSDEQRRNAWGSIKHLCASTKKSAANKRRLSRANSPGAELDVIAFRQQTFPAKEVNKSVRIHLNRTGKCLGVIDVLVRTAEITKSCFMAKAGKDYVHKEVKVRFEPGQAAASFDVQLLPTKCAWSTSCYFSVLLVDVPTENALLGGPCIAVWATEYDTGVEARVAILQDSTFPGDIPKDRFNSPSGLWLMWYYTKDRAKDRGPRFWKTLAGRMYNPLHNVLVTVYVRKLLIDWACSPSAGGDRWRIIFITCVQLFSLFLLRIGDQMQIKNRGRTGGVRMVHRRQLLQKMMMIDHKETYDVTGVEWFYNALLCVEMATVSGYWQSFEICKNSFALLLCFISTVVDPLTGFKITKTTLFPSIGIVVAVPISVWLVLRRREALAALLEKKMEGEKAWVDTFSWLSRASRSLYSFGPRELSYIESMFWEQSQRYIGLTRSATAVSNDSLWVTRWMGAAGYILVMLWGAFRLLDEKRAGTNEFTTGDYVLLLSVYLKFGNYLNAVNTCIVKILSAAVSVRRLSNLLNLQENHSLFEEEATIDRREFLPSNVIELRSVLLQLPADKPLGLGAMGCITAPVSCTIPLGRLVMVHGGNEASRLSFMALIAKVLQPTDGEILCPRHAWAVMMPPVPVDMPAGLTVQECIALAGAPAIIAHSLAQLLELRANRRVETLAPGDLQLLAIARAMLRDPEVLVLIRPFAYIASKHRPRLAELLRAWQIGGAERIVEGLLEQQGKCLNVLEERVNPRARTLILAGPSIPGGKMPGDCSNDVKIILDALIK